MHSVGLRGLDWRQDGHSGGCYVSKGEKIRTCTWTLLSVSYIAGRVLAGLERRDGFERYLSYTFRLFLFFHTRMKVYIHTALHIL